MKYADEAAIRKRLERIGRYFQEEVGYRTAKDFVLQSIIDSHGTLQAQVSLKTLSLYGLEIKPESIDRKISRIRNGRDDKPQIPHETYREIKKRLIETRKCLDALGMEAFIMS